MKHKAKLFSNMEDILKLDSPHPPYNVHLDCTDSISYNYQGVRIIDSDRVSHDLLWIVVYYTGAVQGEGLGVA